MVSFVTRVVFGGLSLLTLAQASPVYDALTPRHRKVKMPTPHVKHNVKRSGESDKLQRRLDNSTGDGLDANLQRDLVTLKTFASTITQNPEGLVANWTAEAPDVCSFDGVYCEQDPSGNYALAEIEFTEYRLGNDLSLHGFLDKLYDLAVFHVGTNGFSGTVPDLSALPYLYELDLSINHLSGEFPLAVLGPVLEYLDIRYNSFTGPLPANLFTGQDYEYLFVNNNQFTGPIPEFENPSNVTYISLANNQLTGPIPDSWANNFGLLQVLFLGNQLSGTVPEGLCAIPGIQIIDVSNNPGLVGPLGSSCKAAYDSGVLTITGTAIQV